jgi:hypothetical protein
MAAARSREITQLERVFGEEFAGYYSKWPEILDLLYDAIAPIRVQPVN